MNLKVLSKRVLPIIIALAVIIVLAITLSLISTDRKAPSIEDKDGTFLTIDGIEVSNKAVYKDLRFNYGINTLISMIDKDLLKGVNNKNGVSYYDAVTQEEIDEAIEKAIFPNGRTGVTEDDDKTILSWENNQYVSNGLRSDEDYNNFYRLTLAKRAYAKAILAEDTETVKDADISAYYSNNYKKAYWAVVVKFDTLVEAENALNQLGIKAKDVEVTVGGTTRTVKKWVDAATDAELTEEQVKQAHIDLYNYTVSHTAPGYPNIGNPANNLVLGDDQYTISGGKIVFNTTKDSDEDSPKNLFYYTTERLNALSSSLTTAVNSLSNYLVSGTDLEKTYLVAPRAAGSAYYFAMKLNFVDPVVLYEDGEVANEDLKAEIVEKIVESKVTDSVIKVKMAELRKEKGIIIYDPLIEANYISGFDTTHKKSKKSSSTVVATVNKVDYTAQNLFVEMSNLYGVASGYTQYLREMLFRSEHNTIYDVDQEKVLDAKLWKDLKDQIDYLKTSFANGSFGVDASYGWENFLRDYNNVESEKDLLKDLLYDKVFGIYTKTLTDTNQELWDDVYVPNMQKIKADYLNATGMHILIHKQDDKGALVEPTEWSATDKALAEELYDLVLAEVKTERPDKFQSYLETTFIRDYQNAPKFLPGVAQDVASQPVYSDTTTWFNLDASDYKYSKFKTAGLLVKFETLSSIKAGQMVKPFEDAVRQIWDESEAANTYGDYKVIYDKTYGDYIVTDFGYHLYVNLTTTKRTTLTVSNEEKVVDLPAYADVLAYEGNPVDGEEDRELTTFETRQITEFYTPIRTEINGNTYKTLKISQMLLTKADKVAYTNSALNSVYTKTLEINIANSYESLKYVTAE